MKYSQRSSACYGENISITGSMEADPRCRRVTIWHLHWVRTDSVGGDLVMWIERRIVDEVAIEYLGRPRREKVVGIRATIRFDVSDIR